MKKQISMNILIFAVTASSGLTQAKTDVTQYTSGDGKIVIEGIEMTHYVKGKAVEHRFFPYDKRH